MAEVTLRLISEGDLPLLLAWAWIPQVWEYLPTSREGEKLTWDSHLRWWKRRKNRVDWLISADRKHPHPVGVVHINDLDKEYPEIGLYIGEVTLWGKGIGTQALEEGIHRMDTICKWGRRPYKGLHAVIHPENVTSVKLFTGVGFIKIGEARKEQGLYEYPFNRPEVTVSLDQVRNRLSYKPSPA